jgi:hypothetical protein
LKKLIGSDVGSYVFDPTNRTITVSGIRPFDIENVLLVSNAGTMIYSFADTSLGGSVTDNVITLTYDTTSMSADDHLQIWIDIPKERLLESEQYGLDPEYTYDAGLNEVFGPNPITDGEAIKTAEKSRILRRVDGRFNAVGQELRIDCEGANTIGIQITGTWSATIAFEASIDGGNFAPTYAVLVGYSASYPTYSDTRSIAFANGQNGIFLSNAAGIKTLRVRCSAYTSGIVGISMIADSAKPPIGPPIQATYDNNLYGTLGAVQLFSFSHTEGAQQVSAPTISPTQPTSYADNKYAQYPQRFRRIRVESEIGRAHV